MELHGILQAGSFARLARAGLLLAILLSPASLHADVRLQVLATDPQPTAVLGRWEQFSLRIGYTSDRPIYIRAQPFFAGKAIPARNSGSYLQPHGTGEALFWFDFTEAERVDTVLITAESKKGSTLARISIPVQLTWTGKANDTIRKRADWVERLETDQHERVQSQSYSPMNGVLGVLLAGIGFAAMMTVPGYFVLQGVLLVRYSGGWRKAAAAPLILIVPALIYTVFAFLKGSNLFPIVLILASPFAFFYLLILLIVHRLSSPRVAAAPLPTPAS
ncbi:MAG TPA: hypothetical protein VMH80_07360 [Bryobacteraceae bacterium]|nr:hypothetical protein [Bryobacteraceae bacterium]